MRYLRVVVILLFVVSLGISAWANLRYYSRRNTDIPTISSDTDLLQVSVKDDPAALMKGLTAQDDTDGDLTAEIMVASRSHFIEPGVINVKYVVFDRYHNAASLTRKVQYTDYEHPRFSLTVPPVMARGGNFDLLKYVKVEDCLDGDISDRIRVITNTVNIFAAGVYPVTLEVTNSCGDLAQLTLWVTVLEKENTAAITLSQYIVYVKQGTKLNPYRYISGVTDIHNMALPKPGSIYTEASTQA